MKVTFSKSKVKDALLAFVITILFFVPIAVIAKFSILNFLLFFVPGFLAYFINDCIQVKK